MSLLSVLRCLTSSGLSAPRSGVARVCLLVAILCVGCDSGVPFEDPYQPHAKPASTSLPPLLPARPSSAALRSALEPRADGALSINAFHVNGGFNLKRPLRVTGVVREIVPDCVTITPPANLSPRQKALWTPFRSSECRASLAALISDEPRTPRDLVISGYDHNFQSLLTPGTRVTASGQFSPESNSFEVNTLWVSDPQGRLHSSAFDLKAALSPPPPPTVPPKP